MPVTRTRIESIRRRDLIEAAYQTFLEHGLNGMTMARISKRSGLSQGVVNYYFKSKDELIFAVVRKGYFMSMAHAARGLRAARSPRERLDAIISSNIPEAVFTPDGTRAWIGFYTYLTQYPELQRLQRVFDQRVKSNLVHALSGLVPRDAVKDIAFHIITMVDGLWLRRLLDRDEISAAEAVDLIWQSVDLRIEAARRKEESNG